MSTATSTSPTSISAEQFKKLVDSGERFKLLDTRDEESFEGWRLADAIQFFYKSEHEFDLEAFQAETGLDRTDPIVTICAKGESSRFIVDELIEAGFEDVRYVEGGMRAWSSVYDIVDIDTDSSVEIIQLQRRAKGCLGYLVCDSESEVAAAVDPTRHIEQFQEAATGRGYEIERVFDTHIHADHISGGRRLASELDVPYHLGERVSERAPNFQYEPLERNEVVTVGTVEIKAVFTPGHTSGMSSYLIGSEALLTGDTIFVDSVGRTELQFGDADAESGAALLYDSLHGTVLAEPDSVTVLPGHFTVTDDGEYSIDPGTEAATTIQTLRTELPVLRHERDAFVNFILESTPEKPPNYERIISTNRGEETPDEEESITLELGPNRCAAE